MAINQKATKKKNNQEYVLNDVQNVRQWDDGGITFTAVVNGIFLYGLRVVQTSNDDWFVSFPSRKGSDGKYYKHVYFPVDEDMKGLIETAINAALAE